MKVNQISVFAENKSGSLADISALLGENNIDIRAMSLADKTDFGIVRMIVSDTDKALKIFKDNGFAVKCSEVTALSIANTPGGLAEVLAVLKSEDIVVEYLYAFVGKNDKRAKVVMKLSDPDTAEQLFSAKLYND